MEDDCRRVSTAHARCTDAATCKRKLREMRGFFGGLVAPRLRTILDFSDRDRPTCTSEAGLVAAPPIAPRCERYHDGKMTKRGR
jgi:hypothetical protein